MTSKAAAALGLALGLTLVVLGATMPAPVRAQQEDPKDIIAVQLRKQGFACGKAENAVKDEDASGAEGPVWTLKCDNASYRVKMVPGQAAKVEKLD